MTEVFGSATVEGDTLVSSYGVMARIEAKIISKTILGVATENVADARSRSDEEIMDSKKKLNVFLEKTTGFTAKERQKRANEKAKKGTL